MLLFGNARLEFGRDRSDDREPDLGRAPQRLVRGDSDRGDSNRGNSRRRLLPSPFSQFDNNEDIGRSALRSRNTVQGMSNRGNDRVETLPSSSSIFGGNNDDDGTTPIGTAAPGILPRQATEPPPYRTVENLAISPSQRSIRSTAPYHGQGDRSDDRSQASGDQNDRGAAVTDFMKNLQSRVKSSDQHDKRDQSLSSRERLGDAITEFMQTLSLGRSSNRSNAASETRKMQGRPHGNLEVVTTHRRHGRSGKRSHIHRDSSDSDSSDSSDSDYSTDKNGLVKIMETYRPVGRGSSRRDDRGTAGKLRMAVTETGREVLKEVQKEAVAMFVAKLCEDRKGKDGRQKVQKPRSRGSYLLDLALRAGRDKGEDGPEVIYDDGPRFIRGGPRFIRGGPRFIRG